MTKFRIIGCNKESGEDVDFVIEANTYLDAQKKANDLGCLVSDVRIPSNQKVQTFDEPNLEFNGSAQPSIIVIKNLAIAGFVFGILSLILNRLVINFLLGGFPEFLYPFFYIIPILAIVLSSIGMFKSSFKSKLLAGVGLGLGIIMFFLHSIGL